MSKKLVIMLMALGMSLGLFAGCSEEEASAVLSGDSSFEGLAVLSNEGDLVKNAMSLFQIKDTVSDTEETYQMNFVKQQHEKAQLSGGIYLNEEQQFSMQVYEMLAKDIYQQYHVRFDMIVKETRALIADVYDSIPGVEYAEFKTAYNSTGETYSALVNGFYSSGEYSALQAELNALSAQLTALKKGTDKYNELLDEINIVWGKISVLAGEINSEFPVLSSQIGDIMKEIKGLFAAHEKELRELTEPVLPDFEESVQTPEAAFMQELMLLIKSLGI